MTGLEVAQNDSHQLPGGLAANAAHSGPSRQLGQQVSRNNHTASDKVADNGSNLKL
jgi:hypothetical protein